MILSPFFNYYSLSGQCKTVKKNESSWDSLENALENLYTMYNHTGIGDNRHFSSHFIANYISLQKVEKGGSEKCTYLH